jgi:hypothetical protein
MITILPKISNEVFKTLEEMLKKITIKLKGISSSRNGFGKHRSITFGITKGRFNNKIGLSYFSKKYPELYEEILKIGKIICPFEFKSIHLNNNVICPKHKDKGNTGESLLISFGDYEGCNIVIENIKYDAKYTPIIFNGSLLEHWNTDDLIGNKYSLVFFN